MVIALERLGQDAQRRSIMLLEMDSWEAWPADLELPSSHFVLFLAADALNTPADFGRAARRPQRYYAPFPLRIRSRPRLSACRFGASGFV
jgi:hypothetical protein